MQKKIADRLTKTCVVCGKIIHVISYTDRSYRGGHYFDKISVKAGKSFEYWECPTCYRNK